MTSLDSNLLFYALDKGSRFHSGAFRFVLDLGTRADVVLSEFVLVEPYRLLRNPVLNRFPLSPAEAVTVVQTYRSHRKWRITGFPTDSSKNIHDDLWETAAQPNFAYRRIYDARLALVLRSQGVVEFATANTKDFQDFGFSRVWNPVAATE